MKHYNFPGFDKLEEGSPLYLTLPLCKKYITEDSLCPIEALLAADGSDKFFQMVADLKKLAEM